MQLTESQEQARQWFFDWENNNQSEGTLIGAAGSGKTFLLATLIQDIFNKNPNALIAISAPTNKAVGVLEGKLTQFSINKIVSKPEHRKISLGTIHKFLRSVPNDDDDIDDTTDLEFNSDSVENRPYGMYDYIFVDEASMINTLLFQMIMESVIGKILFVGDPYQLFAVKENRVSAPFRQIKNVFYLEGIVRYQGNILKTASRIRDRIEWEEVDYPYVFPKSVENIEVYKEKGIQPEDSKWFTDFLDVAIKQANSMGNPNPDYLRMLVYKRRTLESFSTKIRVAVYGEMAAYKYMIGECLFSHQPFHAYYDLKKHSELLDLSWVKSRTEDQVNRTKFLLDERDRARKTLPNSEDFMIKSSVIEYDNLFSPLSRLNNPIEYDKYFVNWEIPKIEFCLNDLIIKGRTYQVAIMTDGQRKQYAQTMQYIHDYWKAYNLPELLLNRYKALLNKTFNVYAEYQSYPNEQDKNYCYTVGNSKFKIVNKLYSSFVITIHKSQGTTINKNFVNYADCFTRNPSNTQYENNSILFRLLYTAITRTSEDLYVFTRR